MKGFCINMKKPIYICIIALLVLQIVLMLLRAFGVIAWRWLWVTAPVWAAAVVVLLYGIFASLQKKASGRSESTDEEK